MASNFYDKHLPDYGDLDNVTQTAAGYRFGVRENDGGVGIYMCPINDDSDGDTCYCAFLNVSEAKDLVNAFEEAIARAEPKNANGLVHQNRIKSL